MLKKAKFIFFFIASIIVSSPIYVAAQNAELEVDINKVQDVLPKKETNILLGKTLQTGDPNKYIVTIGPWEKRVRFSQVQGTRFNAGNPFKPNAVRSYTVSFEGEFSNIVIYNKEDDTYYCLFDTIEYITQFQAISSQQTGFQEDVIVCERGDKITDRSAIVIVGLNSMKMMEPLSANLKLLDWSINPFKSSIVLLIENQGEIVTVEVGLDQIYQSNTTTNL